MRYLEGTEIVRRGPPGSLKVLNYTITYPAGIRWTCLKCAECCRDIAGHKRRIRLLAAEAEDISKGHGIETTKFVTPISRDVYCYEMQKTNGECIFLSDSSCKVYACRPLVCRFYPFELREESETLKILLTGERCPGINRGGYLQESFFNGLASVAIERLKVFDA